MSDIFYPGNPQRRIDVVFRIHKVYTILKQDFSAVNDLITFLNTNVHDPSPNISTITFDDNATFAANAQKVIDKMRELQTQVTSIDANLQKQLTQHAGVHSRITSAGTTFQDKTTYFNTLKTEATITSNTLSSIGGLMSMKEIVADEHFTGTITGLGQILAASFAAIAVGSFATTAITAAAAVILEGSIEKALLNRMIEELDGLLVSFGTPSEAYFKKTFEVLGIMNYIMGKL